jgi:Na+-translocating ferredoxin:NAD+ oxidoreductase RnfG subunit
MGEDKTPDTTEPQDDDGSAASAAPVQTLEPTAPSNAPATNTAAGMPDYVRFPLVLGVLCLVASLGLAAIHQLTRESEREAERRKVEDAYRSILGERFGSAVAKGGYVELRDADDSAVALAANVECDNCYNAGEPIKLMVVLDMNRQVVLGIRVISSKETPGFGERINDTVASRSLFGMVAGRKKKARVLTARGPRVGVTQKRPDGSIALTLSDGSTETIPGKDVTDVTPAPFPPRFVDQFTGVPVQEAGKLGGRIDGLTGATITSRAVVGGVSKASDVLKNAISDD